MCDLWGVVICDSDPWKLCTSAIEELSSFAEV